MLYMFIKMSSKWFCKKVESIYFEEANIKDHIENGNIVCFADDIEDFASEMEIEENDIEMVA